MNPGIREVAQELARSVPATADEIEKLLAAPPDEKLGDLAFPCFLLSKALRKAPAAIAQELAAKVPAGERITGAAAAGPYLNLRLRRGAFARSVSAALSGDLDGCLRAEDARGKTAVVEFSSPNIAKTFAVHHLRSTVIGNALANLYEALGYKVVRLNHPGDWGTQFGTLLVAFRKWGDPKEFETNPIQTLMALYVRFNAEKKANPALEVEARAAFAALEKGDPEARRLWQRFREESLKEFGKIYKTLNIRFDRIAGESEYAPKADQLIAWLSEKGLTKTSEGALIVDLETHKMPPCLLRKGDEATLYATRDLVAARERWEEFHFDKMLYVVGMPQELHFRQVFKVLELAGCDWVSRCEHVPFGHYLGMKTREGTYVLLDDVLKSAVEKTEEKIRQAVADGSVLIPEGDVPAAARTVGVGAVVFNDLKTRRVKDVTFDWEELLNFQGRTGPYVQYAHARIRGILRKAAEQGLSPASPAVGGTAVTTLERLDSDAEFRLLRQIAEFPRQVRAGAADAEPSYVANYLLDLCKAFSQFYQDCPVLQAEPELRAARLQLAAMTGSVIRKGLSLLEIEAPERM